LPSYPETSTSPAHQYLRTVQNALRQIAMSASSKPPATPKTARRSPGRPGGRRRQAMKAKPES
jgi:hypothetical protein